MSTKKHRIASSDTPLTDAQPPIELYDPVGTQYDSTLVKRDFANELEKNNAALRGALESVIQFIPHRLKGTKDVIHPVLARARAALRGIIQKPKIKS